jgi:RimJ/RimL family protein N-acetyltransferase
LNIRGKRIIVRAIEPADLPLLHSWFNDPDLVGGLGDIHFPASLRQQEQWYERAQSDEGTIRLAVHMIEGTLIGYTGFWNIHWRDRRAVHAVVIGDPEYRGKGFGREIILTCARYAFEEMGLHRLDAGILETNTASLDAYRECGFQIEGTLREHALRAGKRVDRLLLGLLKREYDELIERTRYWDTSDDSA